MKTSITLYNSTRLEEERVKKPILVLTGINSTDLSRRLVTSEGLILCECDGTSARVRKCLNDTNELMSHASYINNAKDRYHLTLVDQCGKLGFSRVSDLTDPETRK